MLCHLVVTFQQACVFCRLIVGALGNLGREALLLTLQVVKGAEGGEGLLYHRTHSVGYHLLRQVSYCLASGHDNSATLRLLPTTKYLQKGRLAGTVHTDKTYTVMVTYIKGDVVEKIGASKLHREIIDANQGYRI